MKKHIFLVLSLAILSSCSTGGPVDTGMYTYPRDLVAIDADSAESRTAERSAALSGSKSETGVQEKATGPVARERKRTRIPAIGVAKDRTLEEGAGNERLRGSLAERVATEDDDDIGALLGSTSVENFDIPIVFNDAVKYYIGYFTNEKRKVFGNWLRRSKRYVPMITEILRKNGMPEDLVYLAMIESGFNPKAYSTAKACGPWQFIYETGGRYGLKVNYWIDERRDPEKSTVAAAKYLRFLFNQFGHWYLAAAGYNAGENRVERAMVKHNTSDFWELYKYNALPRETRNYIPQLIAAAIIAKEPEKYGFGSITYDSPIQFVGIEVPPATPLTAISRASGISLENVRSYNPELVRGITPPGNESYEIKLPSPLNTSQFSEKLASILENERTIKSVVSYKVKKRDTMAKILKKHGVKSDDLYLVNNCEGELKVKPGMVIAIPRFGGPSRAVVAKNLSGIGESKSKNHAKKEREEAKEKPEKAVKVAKAEKDEKSEKVEKAEKAEKVEKSEKTEKPQRIAKAGKTKSFHIVKKGDTLTSISDKYGVDVADLKSINKLKNGKVVPNMKIRLVSYHVEKKKPAKLRYYVVKKGDTLDSISDKYGISIESIKSANRLKSNKIQAKMKLKIIQNEG